MSDEKVLSERFQELPLERQIDSIWRTKQKDVLRLKSFVAHCHSVSGISAKYLALDSMHRERMDKLIQIHNLTQEANLSLSGDADKMDLKKRFAALETMVEIVAKGESNGLLVLGAGGIGKTFTVEKVLTTHKIKYAKMSGHVSPSALYNFLYDHRDELCLIDDADSVFDDETPLNILKAVLDTKSTREVSWMSPSTAITAPSTYIFKGKAIFITNKSMDKIKKSISHMEALLTRVLFVNFEVSKQDILGRIKSIASDCDHPKMERPERMRVYSFIKENADRILDLNLRTLIHAYSIYLFNKAEWRKNLRYMWSVRG